MYVFYFSRYPKVRWKKILINIKFVFACTCFVAIKNFYPSIYSLSTRQIDNLVRFNEWCILSHYNYIMFKNKTKTDNNHHRHIQTFIYT